MLGGVVRLQLILRWLRWLLPFAQTQFGLEINNDGTIGEPVTTNLQDLTSELLSGTSAADLPVGYETSGLTWHQVLEKICSVSDEGIVSMNNLDGTDLVH